MSLCFMCLTKLPRCVCVCSPSVTRVYSVVCVSLDLVNVSACVCACQLCGCRIRCVRVWLVLCASYCLCSPVCVFVCVSSMIVFLMCVSVRAVVIICVSVCTSVRVRSL